MKRGNSNRKGTSYGLAKKKYSGRSSSTGRPRCGETGVAARRSWGEKTKSSRKKKRKWKKRGGNETNDPSSKRRPTKPRERGRESPIGSAFKSRGRKFQKKSRQKQPGNLRKKRPKPIHFSKGKDRTDLEVWRQQREELGKNVRMGVQTCHLVQKGKIDVKNAGRA